MIDDGLPKDQHNVTDKGIASLTDDKTSGMVLSEDTTLNKTENLAPPPQYQRIDLGITTWNRKQKQKNERFKGAVSNERSPGQIEIQRESHRTRPCPTPEWPDRRRFIDSSAPSGGSPGLVPHLIRNHWGLSSTSPLPWSCLSSVNARLTIDDFLRLVCLIVNASNPRPRNYLQKWTRPGLDTTDGLVAFLPRSLEPACDRKAL